MVFTSGKQERGKQKQRKQGKFVLFFSVMIFVVVAAFAVLSIILLVCCFGGVGLAVDWLKQIVMYLRL